MQSSVFAIVQDGKIQLPNPSSIPEGTKVLIIPIPLNQDPENNIDSKDDLEYFALQNLNQCYGENEPEYTLERRQRGSAKGQIKIAPDFKAPLEDFQEYMT